MSLTPVDLSAKLLFAFLNGVCKITFHKDSGVTAEDIKDTIFPDTPVSEVSALIAEYAAVFSHAASQAWSWQELSDHLTGSLGVSADSLPSWDKVWKAEHAHAHAGLVAGSVWNTTYEDVSWRVDLLSASPAAAGAGEEEAALPEPVALVQIKTTSASGAPARLTFEADKAKVKELLGRLHEIQAVLSEHA